MLQSLHVKNLALIDEAEVDFEKGLNILTGETGAGKSIIIGSVNLALGAKASKDLIRKGADYALIELVFSADSPKLLEGLREFDIYPEENELIMTRKIMPGRSVCRINGETVSASVMRTVASWLIDIHGQHEHQSLLTTGNHLKYLDAYGDGELKGPRNCWQKHGIFTGKRNPGWKKPEQTGNSGQENCLFSSLKLMRLKKRS